MPVEGYITMQSMTDRKAYP